MSANSRGKRELVKFSGEVLGNPGEGINQASVISMAHELAVFRDTFGLQLAAMPGAGNHFRGRDGNNLTPRERCENDFIGMGFTVLNAVALTEALNHMGVPAICMTTLSERDMPAEVHGKSIIPYHRFDAIAALVTGKTVCLAGGANNVGFTTDAAGLLMAAQLGADFIKGTNAPGVCNRDPRIEDPENPLQVYRTLPFKYAHDQNLDVLDPVSRTLLTVGGIDMMQFRVYDARTAGALSTAYRGESGTFLSRDATLTIWGEELAAQSDLA